MNMQAQVYMNKLKNLKQILDCETYFLTCAQFSDNPSKLNAGNKNK